MPRYFRQGNDLRCAQIAAMNIDLWRGKKVHRTDIKKYEKKLNFDPTLGTKNPNFSKWIGKKARRLIWSQFKQALLDGKIIACSIAPRFRSALKTWHLFLVVGITINYKHVLAVNWENFEPPMFITRQKIIWCMKRGYFWIIDRED